MENNRSFPNVYGMALGFFSILAIVLPKLIVLGFVAIAIVVGVGLYKRKLTFKLDVLSGLFITLYLLYLIYALFTRHPDLAGRYIENKLSFVILPILFSFRLKEKANFYWGIVGFLAAVSILLIQSYASSFLCFFDGGGKACFLASLFSYQHHPSYTSVFLIFAMGLLIYGYRKQLIGFKLFWIIPFLGLLFISSILCLSLAGILFLFALIAVLTLILIYKKWGKLACIFAGVAAPFLLYLSIISIPQVEGEWTNAKWYADEYVKDSDAFIKARKYPMSGTEVRIVMWTVATKVLKKYPFGVGTGNVDEVLTNNLNTIDQKELAKQEYNPHNQFLQTGIEIGWIGLLLLLAIVVVGIFYAFKYKNWLLLLIISNFVFNALFESMLQRQSGIVVYTFLICALLFVSNNSLITRQNDSN